MTPQAPGTLASRLPGSAMAVTGLSSQAAPVAWAKVTALASIFAPTHSHKLIHLFLSFGLVGLFLVSIVDSSFVPLPVPGLTDIMIVLFAAQKANWLLLVLVATAGSCLGGYFSYQVGQSGGLSFIEKRTPPRIFRRVTRWMENHAILAVALPALLPPPMPLSPFVLAAGALKMSRNKFLTTFTISRFLRHSAAAWLGIQYGHQVLHFWNQFSQKWGTTILIILWTGIAISLGFAFWKLYTQSHAVGIRARNMVPGRRPRTPQAQPQSQSQSQSQSQTFESPTAQ